MKIRYSPLIIIFSVILFMLSIKGKFIINPSKSLTRGIYRILEKDNINKGDIVCFKMPENIKRLALERNYILQKADSLMKIVAATKDDKVELINDELFINGESWGKMVYQDTYLRKLNPKDIKELQPKNNDEYLLLSKIKNSFDGRYIGVVTKKDILFKTQLFIEF